MVRLRKEPKDVLPLQRVLESGLELDEVRDLGIVLSVLAKRLHLLEFLKMGNDAKMSSTDILTKQIGRETDLKNLGQPRLRLVEGFELGEGEHRGRKTRPAKRSFVHPWLARGGLLSGLLRRRRDDGSRLARGGGRREGRWLLLVHRGWGRSKTYGPIDS
jgi:hypothetical protein